ncbi:MAG: hypothetical protein EPO29_02015 [Betaproteobacteria bacterium]|nr:MAG: hypothetical protein EPO29_02015 [Betaproteobacteria bacterium]
MSIARPLRILLALMLLCAQQLALAHQVWHLGDQSGQPAQQQLCDKHDALGTVGGALHGAAMAPLGEEAAFFFAVRPACVPAASTPGLAPASRGPPSLC